MKDSPENGIELNRDEAYFKYVYLSGARVNTTCIETGATKYYRRGRCKSTKVSFP
jgi:hypothetical protein